MKKWLPVFIIFLAILGGIWFWSLGALPETEASGVSLGSISGEVTVRAAGEEAYRKASDGMRLAEGDTVRTGERSGAVIDFFSGAETELDQNSEVVIAAAREIESSGSPVVKLGLQAGRVWSRVISILDLEGEFTAETNDVVATVRGTSFDLAIEDGGTTLWVADSVVELNGEEEMFVPEGRMMRFASGRRNGDMMPITEESKAREWFARNVERDRAFHEEVETRLLMDAGGDRLQAPGFMRDIVRGSEAMRTAMARDEARSPLTARYLLRRFAIIREQVKEGRLGSAQRDFSRLKQDLRRLMDRSEAEKIAARKAMYLGVRLFQHIDPTNEAYPLKQEIEELLIATSPDDEQAMMMRLMSVQSRLNEAGRALQNGRLDASGEILELARQAHGNASRDMDRMSEGERLEKLHQVMRAIEVRMTHFETSLEDARRVRPLREIELFSETTEAPTEEPLGPGCTDLLVRVIPPVIGVGQTANVDVRAIFEGGEARDVSLEADIRFTGSAASITGNTLLGLSAGSGNVQVTYMCNGEAIARLASLRVSEPVTVQGLIVSPGAVRIDLLQEVTLHAEVLYSNGERKDVTGAAAFSNTTPEFGFLAGNRFVAGQTAGTARVQVQYSEGGQLYTSASLITIEDLPL